MMVFPRGTSFSGDFYSGSMLNFGGVSIFIPFLTCRFNWRVVQWCAEVCYETALGRARFQRLAVRVP